GENKWDLKPSMRCKTDIRVGRVDDVLAVPVQAVYPERGRHYVWVPEGNKFRRQWVQPGRASETMIEIASGLEAGDRVLLREPTSGERVGEEAADEDAPGMGGPGTEGGRPPYDAAGASGSEAGRPSGAGRPAAGGRPSGAGQPAGAGGSGRPDSSSGEQPQQPTAAPSGDTDNGSGTVEDDATGDGGGVTSTEPTDSRAEASSGNSDNASDSG
ncbi:MAG: hypothetical protein ACOC0P_04730, partial [Planctomycetota bacterium]